MGTFIIGKNQQAVQGIPMGRLKRLEDAVSSGTGGGASFVDDEVVSGSGTAFTLASTPIAGSVKLYALGQRLKLTTDYSIAGTSITTVSTWSTGDIVADYRV